MAAICLRRELADLPEPRALYVTPLWLRRFIGAVGLSAGGLGCALVLKGLQAGGVDALAVLAGLLALVPAVWFLCFSKLADWRAWIQLAATPEGLYVAGRDGAAIFLSWVEVTAITVETTSGKGGVRTIAELTLALPEEAAERLGPLQGVEGKGALRTYRPPLLALSGAELAEELKAWRAAAV